MVGGSGPSRGSVQVARTEPGHGRGLTIGTRGAAGSQLSSFTLFFFDVAPSSTARIANAWLTHASAGDLLVVRKGARVWAFADPAGEATNALDREGRVARARTLLAAAP